MRRGLLLTAVVTVTVPGLLTGLAVVGHERGAAQTDVSSAATEGSLPVASAAAGTLASGAAAESPAMAVNQMTPTRRATGLRLLDGAADAGRSLSYQGTELITESGVAGSVQTVSQVWHQGGGQTLVATSSGPASASVVADSDLVSGPTSGVFGVTKALLAMISKHYVAVYRGGGAAFGRPTAIVELYRLDGSLAARYWLDKQTKVPLRRELFDTVDNVITQDSFAQVKFGTQATLRFVAKAASTAKEQSLKAKEQSLEVKAHELATGQMGAPPAWITVAQPDKFVASLTGQGWPVPSRLPDGLPLYAVASAATTSGQVVDLEYSDGLYDVSLFVQRGSLAAADMSGWRQVAVDGQRAFVSGHSVTWAGPGVVYTVIADVPPQTVAQVIAALPRAGPPGLLDRFGRGLVRLAHVINPFS